MKRGSHNEEARRRLRLLDYLWHNEGNEAHQRDTPQTI
jgi:hypothetical protein